MSVIPVLNHFNLVNIQPISFNIYITVGGMPCLQVYTLLFYFRIKIIVACHVHCSQHLSLIYGCTCIDVWAEESASALVSFSVTSCILCNMEPNLYYLQL